MENATILTPSSTRLSCIQLPFEPHIPEGPEYEKKSTLYRCTGRQVLLYIVFIAEAIKLIECKHGWFLTHSYLVENVGGVRS